jgi:hypothetical protein
MTENDLASRWKTQDGEQRVEERLLGGNRLDDLRLTEHDGRVDLRGIAAPAPERLKTFEKEGWVVAELGGTVMELMLKWAGPRQEQGVFNRRDFVEMADEGEAEFAVSLLRRLEAECAGK